MFKILWVVTNANDTLVNAFTTKAPVDTLMASTSTLKVKVLTDKTQIWKVLNRLGRAS